MNYIEYLNENIVVSRVIDSHLYVVWKKIPNDSAKLLWKWRCTFKDMDDETFKRYARLLETKVDEVPDGAN